MAEIDLQQTLTEMADRLAGAVPIPPAAEIARRGRRRRIRRRAGVAVSVAAVLAAGAGAAALALPAGQGSPARLGYAHQPGPATPSASPGTPAPSAPGTAKTPGGSALRMCDSAHLSLSVLGGGGFAGTSIGVYQFTNTATQPCTLTGYPGVSVVDARGQTVQYPAARAPGPGTTTPLPVRTVTLPGAGGHAVFVLASTDNVPNPDCPTAYHGTTLRVYPPGNTQPLLLPDTGPFCDLAVGPVHSPSSTTQWWS